MWINLKNHLFFPCISVPFDKKNIVGQFIIKAVWFSLVNSRSGECVYSKYRGRMFMTLIWITTFYIWLCLKKHTNAEPNKWNGGRIEIIIIFVCVCALVWFCRYLSISPIACGVYLFIKPITDISNDTTQICFASFFILFISLFLFIFSVLFHSLALFNAHDGLVFVMGNKMKSSFQFVNFCEWYDILWELIFPEQAFQFISRKVLLLHHTNRKWMKECWFI